MLDEVMELKVPEVRHRGLLRKQWKNNIEDDLREMNIREKDTMDREGWRAAIKSSNPVAWRRRR